MATINVKSKTDIRRWLKDVTAEVAEVELRFVRKACKQSDLRNGLKTYRASNGRRLQVIEAPHYWARFYHDGIRTEFTARPPRRWLVFFPENATQKDPRLAGLGGRYPVRLNEVRRLTKEEFAQIVKTNKEFFGRFSTPRNAIITKEAGPTPPHPFFDEGFKAASTEVRELINDRFLTVIVNALARGSGRIRGGIERDKVKFVLR